MSNFNVPFGYVRTLPMHACRAHKISVVHTESFFFYKSKIQYSIMKKQDPVLDIDKLEHDPHIKGLALL